MSGVIDHNKVLNEEQRLREMLDNEELRVEEDSEKSSPDHSNSNSNSDESEVDDEVVELS